jgi:hypothetical protein
MNDKSWERLEYQAVGQRTKRFGVSDQGESGIQLLNFGNIGHD